MAATVVYTKNLTNPEHVEGHTLSVLLAYSKKRLRRGIEYGDLQAHPGQTQIWR